MRTYPGCLRLGRVFWQSSGGEEEWLAALALRGGIVRNLLVRPLALQRQLVGDGKKELLQSHGRRHVAVVRGEQAVIARFKARVAIALMLAQSQRHVERHLLVDDAELIQLRRQALDVTLRSIQGRRVLGRQPRHGISPVSYTHLTL